MPKDYSQGKIYQIQPICEHEEGDVYIGSTIQKGISHRLAEHNYNYKKWKNGINDYTSSFYIFEKYGIENCKIILIESFPCHNNDELRAREAHYQKEMKCVNKVVAFRSKEERLEYKKQYRIDHRDELAEQKKYYREEHHDEILQSAKNYREKNKEVIKEKSKIYYQNKKQELSEIITCECGREITKYNLKRHQCSDIHNDLMLQLTKEK